MEHIASGRTAEIYAWDAGHVVKVFKAGFDRSMAEYEARIARTVAACNADAPAVGELIEIEGRPALIYQRIDGPTMLETIMQQGDSSLVETLANLHAALHNRRCPDLPPLHSSLAWKIDHAGALTPGQRAALLRRLDTMPRDDVICHGDFHPGNILMTASGPVVIDWNDATSGPALADVGRTYLIFSAAARQDTDFAPFIEVLRDAYLSRYCQRRGVTAADITVWLPLLAAARLSEGIADEQVWLLDVARKAL